MKNSLKSLIFGFLAITLALGFTSCGDESEDPTPVNGGITIEQLVGEWVTTSVEFNGNTITQSCDLNWGTADKLRKVDFNFKGGQYNFTDMTDYRCVGGSTSSYLFNDLIPTLTGTTLDFDGSYKYKVISVTTSALKIELISTVPDNTPIGAVYTLKKI